MALRWVFELLHAQRKPKLKDSEREEESAEFKNTHSPRSPLPLTVVPSSVTPERVLVDILRVWILCVCRAAHLHRG